MVLSQRKQMQADKPHVAVMPYKTFAGPHRQLVIAWLQRHVGTRGYDWDNYMITEGPDNAKTHVCFRDVSKAVMFKLRWAGIDA